MNFNLLYKISRDGDRTSNFTEKVVGISPTLVIIQLKSGYRFCGYTSVKWKMTGNYSYVRDENAFIFSIDKRKKYSLKRADYAICGDPQHFTFGGSHELTIWDKCISNDNSKDYTSNDNTY